MYESLKNVWRRWRNLFQGKPKTGGTETEHPVEQNTPSVDEPSVKNAAPSGAQEDNDPRRTLSDFCYQRGYEQARQSGALKPDPSASKSLESLATSIATATGRTPNEAEEKRKARKYEALVAEQERRAEVRDRARVAVVDARRRRAKVGRPEARPGISSLLRHATTLGLTGSIAPTFHDLAVGLDPFSKWLVGGLAAWGVGLALVHGMLPSESEAEGDNKEKNGAKARGLNGVFWAGVGVGLALFGVRVVFAQTYGDFLLAAALTLAEGSFVFLWERKTARLAVDLAAWAAKRGRQQQADALVEAAQEHLADRRNSLDTTGREIEVMDRVFADEHLLADPKTLITIAVKAIQAGYHAGISYNRGAVDGAADLGGDDDDE